MKGLHGSLGIIHPLHNDSGGGGSLICYAIVQLYVEL